MNDPGQGERSPYLLLLARPSAAARAEALGGRSWGDPELAEPGPYSAIDPEDFYRLRAEGGAHRKARRAGAHGRRGARRGPHVGQGLPGARAAAREAVRRRDGR